MTTKEQFNSALWHELFTLYPERYAGGKTKPEMIQAVANTMTGHPGQRCDISGPAWVNAWRKCGMKGKPTYKALQALPMK